MGEDAIIVAIVFGTILSIVFLATVGTIINNWVKRGSGSKDLTKNKEFLAALREFKENTEKRLSNLEEIVLEEKNSKKNEVKSGKQKEQSRSIEVELNEETEKEKSENSGNLRNMLNQ